MYLFIIKYVPCALVDQAGNQLGESSGELLITYKTVTILILDNDAVS